MTRDPSPKSRKLELTWVGKEERPRPEPRILLDVPELSHAAAARRPGDHFDNRLIQGDNLLALKALEAEFLGQVKCVFIDPPYNTGSAFAHYDDGVEHSLWLSMMRDRLELIHKLLCPEGSIWITVDDNEVHYLKVICDEIFGRQNFIIHNTIRRSAPTGHKAINPTPVQVADYLIVYAKNKHLWSYKPQYTERDFDKAYNRFIENYEDGPSEWKIQTLSKSLNSRGIDLEAALLRYPERIIRFAQPSFDAVGAETRKLIVESRKNPGSVYIQSREFRPDIYLLKGERILFYKDKMKYIDGRLVTAELLTNIWTDIPYQGIAGEGDVVFQKGKKPEKLLQRVIEIATNPGDLVLDSFAGSGTTGAVAHKMGRRWIMVELGEHARTHCAPRLNKVVNGADPGGVTAATGWAGGGGYRYQRLAPSLLTTDRHGRRVIDPAYNPAMLAEAVCRLTGFAYAPSTDPALWWLHGRAAEGSYVFVTTDSLAHDALARLSDEVGEGRHLLVCCKAFLTEREGAFPNLTLRKIPLAVLSACEWGRDDYSLRVAALPEAAEADAPAPPAAKRERKPKAAADAGGLFDADDADEGAPA